MLKAIIGSLVDKFKSSALPPPSGNNQKFQVLTNEQFKASAQQRFRQNLHTVEETIRQMENAHQVRQMPESGFPFNKFVKK